MPFNLTPLTPPHYGSRAGVEAEYGVFNVATWADIQSTSLAADITARIETALSAADDWIAMRALGYPVTIPTSASPLYPQLASIANLYAGAWLYKGRGEPAQNQEAAGVMAANMRDAEDTLDRILAAVYYAPSGATTPTAQDLTTYPTSRAYVWPYYWYLP